MKNILEQWDGEFEIDGEIEEDLDSFNPEDGEEFHVRLLPK